MTRWSAIDIGTNTVRLLVADVSGDDLPRPVERGLEITRLGQGVDVARLLDSEAAQRTLDAVRRFADRARSAGSDGSRVVGTSALRDAGGSEAFIEAVEEATGAELEILEGADEGRITFLGATRDAGEGPFVVCDIGGGSTELTRGDGQAADVRSLDVGSVRVRERCLASDPPTSGEIGEARRLIDGMLDDVLFCDGTETLIGVAGTVTTLAALELGLDRYDGDRVHGTELSAETVGMWTQRLCAMSVDRIRSEYPVVEPGRADVICAGALILDEIVRRWNYEAVRVSERDILDGLIIDAEHRLRRS